MTERKHATPGPQAAYFRTPPPGRLPEALRPLAKEIADLGDRRAALQAIAGKADNLRAVSDAEAADREAEATAVRAGKKIEPSLNKRKLLDDAADAAKQMQVIDSALAACISEYVALCDENSDAHLAHARETYARSSAAYRAAVEQLEVLRGQFLDDRHLVSYWREGQRAHYWPSYGGGARAGNGATFRTSDGKVIDVATVAQLTKLMTAEINESDALAEGRSTRTKTTIPGFQPRTVFYGK